MSGIDLEDIRLDSETDPEDINSTKNSTDDDKQVSSQEPEQKPKRDFSKCSLVEAAQYGLLARCRELVEVEGASVTKADAEGITVLHWAAINNRIPVASYFLQKGADINALGGELKSAPIHWAVRQGHLSMVIHLMRYGALPDIVDSEGLNCLHIAAQFGFTSIVGYMISCRTPVPIDSRDSLERTPLMHAAARANRGFDTTRLLVSLGADMMAKDNNSDTALHHAASQLNYVATKVLVETGAPLEEKNKEGKTPYDLAMENQNNFGMDQITMARQKRNPRGLKEYITREPRVSWWIMFLFPGVFLTLFGWVGVLCPNWWTYLIASSIMSWLAQVVIRVYLPVLPDNNPAAFGIVVGFKTQLYLTAMLVFYNTGILEHYIIMHLFLFFTLAVFYKTSKSDPGLIPRNTSIQEAHRLFLELCEKGLYTDSSFCATCLVRRPLRSKHCAACDQCVARFDHHCPWINNCVGLRNHKTFLLYLGCLLVMLCWGARDSLLYLYQYYPADHGNIIVRAYHYVTAEPWMGYILISCLMHITWVSLLLLGQLFQLICQGFTTNELRNRYRYDYFAKFQGSNPFNRGVLANCADFFGFTCCQPAKVDWTKTYDLPRNYSNVVALASEEEKSHSVKIPLPFSSTWDPSDKTQHRRTARGHGRGKNGYISSDDDNSTCQQQFAANQEFNI